MIEVSPREYHTLILAALLHDIGKLLIKDPAERRRLRQLTEPEFPGGTSDHWTLGEYFLREEQVKAGLLNFDLDYEKLCFAVRWHHYRQGRQSEPAARALALLGDQAAAFQSVRDCVTSGDHLSAGERPAPPDEAIEFTLALQPIFAALYLGRPRPGGSLRYLPQALAPRAAFPDNFPAGDTPEARAYREQAYAPLVTQFKEGFYYALAQAADVNELEAWLYSLLERYAWAIPSDMHPTAEPRDVSLFDHERTTCALATAVYLWQAFAPAEEKNSPHFLFIKGDVSGVQDYIYSIANVGPGGVAKRLRARSFFVTALTEVVAHRLRRELLPGYPLPVAAQIFGGGGQFVLLAPDLAAVRQNLKKIELEVNRWLWQTLQGDLAFVFGQVSAGQAEVGLYGRRTIGKVLGDLDRQVEQAKERRLGALLQSTDEQGRPRWNEAGFTWEYLSYAPHGDCPSCRRLPAQAGAGAAVDQQLCPRCRKDRLLSEQIVRGRRSSDPVNEPTADTSPVRGARFIAYYRGPAPPALKSNVEAREARRLRHSTLTFFEGDMAVHVVLLANLEDRDLFESRPYQLDGFGYEQPTPQGPALVRHFANHVPHFGSLDKLREFCTPERGCVHKSFEEDDLCGIRVRPDGSPVGPEEFPILQTFGCISAAAAEGPNGVWGSQLLGILRADVDNLSLLFREGIGEVKSLSRLATLSRMTDLFFSGWVHETLAQPPPGKAYHRIYTVYAGGDDLCLVGPWDVLIDFARYLAQEFERYTAANPNLSLSAAITVTKPKFPMATSARRAGELLKKAKNAGRNRLHLFGVTARWRDLPPYENLEPALAGQLQQQERQATLLVNQLWAWAERLDTELAYYLREKKAGRRYPISPAFSHRLLRYAEMARAWEYHDVIKADDMLYLARLAYDLGRNVIKSGLAPKEVTEGLVELTQLQQRRLMAGMRLPLTYALYRNRERSAENGR